MSGQERTCATCKHWRYVPAERNWEDPPGTGFPLKPEQSFEDGSLPRSQHGQCDAIQQSRIVVRGRSGRTLLRRSAEELNAMPTLPTFGCVLHEPKAAAEEPLATTDDLRPSPCPFCGDEYWLAIGDIECPEASMTYVYCGNACGARGPSVEGDDAEAIAAWNVRVKEIEAAARVADLERQRDEYRSRPWEARGVTNPCPRCCGSGAFAYGSISTWKGGAGGQMITRDVCDQCWGSGEAGAPWTNLREMRARIFELERRLSKAVTVTDELIAQTRPLKAIEVVPAPGDLCGNTGLLPNGHLCPGCRACK